jgi:hypothetical protein
MIVTTVINTDIIIPIIGAKNMNSTVLMIVSESTTFAHEKSKPFTIRACAMAAPANPPIRVWDEDEGIPYHQVRRFQNIAASNPEKITGKVINSL